MEIICQLAAWDRLDAQFPIHEISEHLSIYGVAKGKGNIDET